MTQSRFHTNVINHKYGKLCNLVLECGELHNRFAYKNSILTRSKEIYQMLACLLDRGRINPTKVPERFNEIRNSPLKKWKFTSVDSEAQHLWDKYTKYKDKMFKITNTSHAPWNIIMADRKIYARTRVIKLILDNIPYDKSTQIHSKKIKF